MPFLPPNQQRQSTEAYSRHTAVNWFSEKNSKFDAIRHQTLRLICTKFDLHWGSAPDPTGGDYSTPPDLLAVFKEPTCKGKGGGRGGGEGMGREKEGEGKEREGRCQAPKYFGPELCMH